MINVTKWLSPETETCRELVDAEDLTNVVTCILFEYFFVGVVYGGLVLIWIFPFSEVGYFVEPK